MSRIKPADYHRIVKPNSPSVNDEGRVAFTRRQPVTTETYSSRLYEATAEDDPELLVRGEGADTEPKWGSGRRLAFVRDDPDDDRGADLWLRAAGGNTERLTRTAGDVSNIVWAPDGRRIAFTQRCTPDERDKGVDVEAPSDYKRPAPDPRIVDRIVYRGQKHYFDGERSHVYVHNLGSGATDRVTDGDDDFVSPEFGGPKTLFYAGQCGPDAEQSIHFDILTYDLESGGYEIVAATTSTARPGTSNRRPALAATAANRLAYTYTHNRDDPETRKTAVRIVDADGGDPVQATVGLDRTVEESTGLRWGPDGRGVYFVTPDSGAYVLRRVDADEGEITSIVAGGHIDGFDVGRDRVVVIRSEWDHPGDVFVTDLDGDDERRLTRLNEELLGERTVGRPEEVTFERDGVEIQGWLLLPPAIEEGVSDGPHPLVVEIHGGPHSMWSASGTMWHEFQTLAAEGYAVFWCNPRGSRGYGQAFARTIAGDWGGVTLGDVLAGVEEVADRPSVDGDQAFVTGGSFGGYMVGWAVGHTDRFDAAIAQRGIYDIGTWYGTTDGSKQVDFDFGATPWDGSETLRQQSPATYVGDIDTPTLVMHSEVDYRVPPCNGELFFAYLKKAGVPTQLIRYPREDHGLSRTGEPGHIVDRLNRILRWFDGYTDHSDAAPVLEAGWDDIGDARTDESGDEG